MVRMSGVTVGVEKNQGHSFSTFVYKLLKMFVKKILQCSKQFKPDISLHQIQSKFWLVYVEILNS